MLTLHAQRYIKVAKVEQQSAWLFVAWVVEKRGDTEVALSEPRVLRVIPKQPLKALAGKIMAEAQALFLAAPRLLTGQIVRIISAIEVFAGFTKPEVISWFSARPPTARV